MKRVLILLLLIIFVTPIPASALEAPQPPDQAESLIPQQQTDFGKALWSVICDAMEIVWPETKDAIATCVSVLSVVLIVSVISPVSNGNHAVQLCATLTISSILLLSANTLIRISANTVTELGEYAKMLFPVLTAALAAQGGVSAATTLYAATILFNSLLCAFSVNVIVPLIYIYLLLSIAGAAIGEDMLFKLRDFVKWLVSWCLKTMLYVFTGYITVTGVISGVTDQSALKATKLTISGMVPVVGGILSDASEAVLVGAGVAKNAVGIYGMLAILCVAIVPFLQTGIHYLLLKLSGGLCGVFSEKRTTNLLSDFSSGMGLLLAMTGSLCLILLISTVCYIKGMQ